MTPPAQAEIEYEERESKVHRRRIASLARRHERGSAERRAEELKERVETLEREQERLQLALSPPAEAHPRVHAARRASGTGTVPRKPRIEGMAVPHRVDVEARNELATMQVDRRDFLRKSAIGAGVLALGAGLGYGSGYAQAAGLTGGIRTVITDKEIAARVIGGVRIATEFIPDPVPAGTGADPYPGSAIQAALNDGLAVYVPSGTWRLSSTISRPVDSVNIIGAGKSTKLVLDGVTPCISAGPQNGWLIANLATDAGGVHIDAATESRITEIWADGILTDNRPRSVGGGGGSGGYYGIRAEDFVTQGDGSASNPYNASAIRDAINSLPFGGGIVFVKRGIWRGSRIFLGGDGQAGRAATIIIMGEGSDQSTTAMGASGSPEFDSAQTGTHVQCGFEIISNGCNCSFENIQLSPNTSTDPDGPTLKYIKDGNEYYFGQNREIGGFFIKNVRFIRGDPALWITGRNLVPADSQMHWNVLLDRVTFFRGGQAVLIDDKVDYNGIFRGDLRHIFCQARQSGSKRAIDVNIANLKGVWTHWLLEDCSTPSADYVLYIRTARTEGFTLSDVDFGDNANAQKGSYFENYLSGQMTIRNLVFRKSVDIRGYVDAEVGRAAQFGDTGTINIVSANSVILRSIRGLDFPLGTISNPGNVLIVKGVQAVGHIDSSSAGASPFTYMNNDSYIEEVQLVGGTITEITRNGQSLGTNRSHILAPGQSITITYTSAPTIRRYGVS